MHLPIMAWTFSSGTKGTIKGLSSQQLLQEEADIAPEIILGSNKLMITTVKV